MILSSVRHRLMTLIVISTIVVNQAISWYDIEHVALLIIESGICAGYIDEDQTIFRICCTTIKVSDKSV
jgi:hypothetical protein